jgi:predicted amidohydrolase
MEPQEHPKDTPDVGRTVRVVCIGFKAGIPLESIAELVDRQGSEGADLIVLPELCRGQNKTSAEPLDGPTVSAMSLLARKHKTYLAVPIDRIEQGNRFNSIVLLDRSGKIACTYDKIFPYWSEYEVAQCVTPGREVRVHQADFGSIGMATCFDVNFPEIWKSLSDKGAELVIWPSECSGGMALQAHAINHHFYIASCSQAPDCAVYDITGEKLLCESNDNVNVSRVSLDLDRGIYHQNFNLARRDELLRKHPQDVCQERWMEGEQWFVLKARRPGVSARELARQYGLEELRDYVNRSRMAIDLRRGSEFAVPPAKK